MSCARLYSVVVMVFAGVALAQAQSTIEPATPLNVSAQYDEIVHMAVWTSPDARVSLSTTCGPSNPDSAIADRTGWAGFSWRTPASAPPGNACFVTAMTGPEFAAVTFGIYLPGATVPAPAAQTVTGKSPAGGNILVSMTTTSSNCGVPGIGRLVASFSDARTALPAPLPVEGAYPHGAVDVNVRTCGGNHSAAFMIDFPAVVPATAQWWSYGASPENASPHWYPIPIEIAGNRVTFTLSDGGYGDTDGSGISSISNYGVLVVPGGVMQDLWWAGLAENGWGMTIVQHRDVLFGNFFVYDAQGKPTWYVMPSGSWNAAHTAYIGSLYLPKGSPYFAYDVSKFDIGPSVGTATITFAGLSSATLQYTINGTSGTKTITRLPFGPKDAPTDRPFGDLWWAGLAQNGWGLVLTQQYATIFGLWFTYDADGKATWFVMPNVSFVFRGTYSGNIYRPEGPPWLGATYDPSRHRTVQVGTFTLRFNSDATGATFDYTIDGKSGSIPISRIPF